ncbi:uroporphyrinogen decarboxylase family protein [Gemmatimonadota bacterium]
MPVRELNIKPDPDFGRLEKVIRRQGIPDRVPFYELYSNIEAEVLCAIGKSSNLGPVPQEGPDLNLYLLRQQIDYMYNLGYDYLAIFPSDYKFPLMEAPTAETTEGDRAYHTSEFLAIKNRQDFEEYRWPDVSQIDSGLFEKAGELIPDGMKVIAFFSGVLENAMCLLGYEGIGYQLFDDEPLVSDTFEAVGARIVDYFENVAPLEVVGALCLGDDMGFKTQTMLSPDVLRKYVFPWHKKIVEVAHRHGKPIILHACGNLTEVMEDIIACGWDAKHSFEDVIQPVWEAKQKYGDRIALLGGFDMDKICRMSEEEVRAHTRFMIENCAPGGGWTLGTGNTVANYIPVANFLAMLEEGYGAGFY